MTDDEKMSNYIIVFVFCIV